jgi:ribosomal protein S18 acetylase RimI-like enzyme
MTKLKLPFRPGRPEDAAALVELVNFAGHGLALYVWERLKSPGETAMEYGRSRAARDSGAFSYANAVVAERDGQCVACLIGYSQPDEPEPIDYAEMPAMFVPLQELENLAPGSWYVNVLATYPEHRGQGLGLELLSIAEERARASGRPSLSLIVADANEDARRLYERFGFREAGRRPMIKESWTAEGRDWVLLVKAF